MEKQYKRLLEMKAAEREALGVSFTKEKVSEGKSVREIYSEIAFGEMHVFQKTYIRN